MSKDKNIIGEMSGEVDLKLHMEAMIGEMRRMLRVELEQVHERMDRMENSRVEQPQSSNWRRKEKVPPKGIRVEEEDYDGDGFDEEDERESVVNNRRSGGRYTGVRNREKDTATFGGNTWRNTRRMEDREDNNLGSIKMKIPSFQGKNDPKAYLEWEKKMELVFFAITIQSLRR